MSCSLRPRLGRCVPAARRSRCRLALLRRGAAAVPIPDVEFEPTTGDSELVALKNMTLSELQDWCLSVGERASRAKQIWRFLYADGNWIRSLGDACGIQNGFGQAFVEKMSPIATCSGGLHLQSVHTAGDGTRKLLFSMDDDSSALVETVIIPVIREQVWRSPHTCASLRPSVPNLPE